MLQLCDNQTRQFASGRFSADTKGNAARSPGWSLTMQHDDSDDPFGFWNDHPTRPLARAHTGTRAHGETRLIPVVRAQRPTRVPEPPRPRNPLMKRVCVLVGSMLLLVPVALSLRSDNQHV
ncbi:MAG: hypothetical protein QOC57_1055, partial [Ilumatobacteraceae bacterium]